MHSGFIYDFNSEPYRRWSLYNYIDRYGIGKDPHLIKSIERWPSRLGDRIEVNLADRTDVSSTDPILVSVVSRPDDLWFLVSM